MARPSAFSLEFSEPFAFSDGSYVLSAELYPTEAEAGAAFAHWGEWDAVDLGGRLRPDAVRYGFPPGEVAADRGDDSPCWVLGASGRGARPVWVLERTSGLAAEPFRSPES